MKVLLTALVALVIGTALAFSPNSAKKYGQQFKYIGPSPNVDYENPNNWTTNNLNACPGEGLINCLVTPNDGSITTPADLADEISLNGFSYITINDTRP